MVLFAKDIAEPDFITVGREATVREAVRLMNQKHHGFVVVNSSAGKPEGVVTEWDLLSKVLAEDRDQSRTTVGEIMSSNLITIDANEGIDRVAMLMAEKGIRRVLVTDREKILGVITSRTVIARMEDYINRISSQIARLSSPQF